jgi:hypothetical protein
VYSTPDFPRVAKLTAVSAYRRAAVANFAANDRLMAQDDVIDTL